MGFLRAGREDARIQIAGASFAGSATLVEGRASQQTRLRLIPLLIGLGAYAVAVGAAVNLLNWPRSSLRQPMNG
jgi:hypothetical protein